MTIKLKMPRRKVNEKMTPKALHRAAETYREMYDKVVANNILLKQQLATVEQQYAKAKWWLNEIIKNHRFTPISTAEMALKDLEELEK